MSGIRIDGITLETLTTRPCTRLDSLMRGRAPFCRCADCLQRSPQEVTEARKARERALWLIERHSMRSLPGERGKKRRGTVLLRHKDVSQLTDSDIASLLPEVEEKEREYLLTGVDGDGVLNDN